MIVMIIIIIIELYAFIYMQPTQQIGWLLWSRWRANDAFTRKQQRNRQKYYSSQWVHMHFAHGNVLREREEKNCRRDGVVKVFISAILLLLLIISDKRIRLVPEDFIEWQGGREVEREREIDHWDRAQYKKRVWYDWSVSRIRKTRKK